MLVCIMPLSRYKKDLYKYIESFELANSNVFKDAFVPKNLCVTICGKSVINKYNYTDLVLASVDQIYIEYYKWNIDNNKGYIPKQIRDEQLLPENLDKHRNEWFLETLRCSASVSGGGFSTGGNGYKWNLLKKELTTKFIFMLDMKSAIAKSNFCKWWYNGKKFESLSSKVILGTKNSNFVGSSYFAIPQIDWQNIHINQKELWDKGLYDEAVLAEMHLKWNEDKTKIIK